MSLTTNEIRNIADDYLRKMTDDHWTPSALDQMKLAVSIHDDIKHYGTDAAAWIARDIVESLIPIIDDTYNKGLQTGKDFYDTPSSSTSLANDTHQL